jgi:hypothetical protein
VRGGTAEEDVEVQEEGIGPGDRPRVVRVAPDRVRERRGERSGEAAGVRDDDVARRGRRGGPAAGDGGDRPGRDVRNLRGDAREGHRGTGEEARTRYRDRASPAVLAQTGETPSTTGGASGGSTVR